MRAADFKPCAACGKGVMHLGMPVFWRVTVERMGIDLQAARQTSAMEMFFGGQVAIARAFQDPDIAKPIVPGDTFLVCEACALEPHRLAVLADSAQRHADSSRERETEKRLEHYSKLAREATAEAKSDER